MIPGLEERIMGGSEEEVVFIADLVRTLTVYSPASYLTESQIKKGAASARADDTKSLKGAILDWITPRGQPLNPPLSRNVKIDRGFHHERTGALLCPAGMDWSNNELVLCDVRCGSVAYLLLGSRRNCGTESYLSLATTGLSFFTTDIAMTRMTRGMASCEVPFL